MVNIGTKNTLASATIAFGLLTIVAGTEARACKCQLQSTNIGEYEVIIRGRVVRSYANNENKDLLVQIRVLERVKGETEDEFLATYEFGTGDSCGTVYRVDETMYFGIRKGEEANKKIGALSYPDLGNLCREIRLNTPQAIEFFKNRNK